MSRVKEYGDKASLGEIMNQKVKVLGVEIDNYYLEESMEIVGQYLENDSLNTVGMISTSLLMAAEERIEIKSNVEKLDLSIIGEVEVLEAAKIDDKQRVEEVEENEFIGTLLMYAINCGKTVYLLVENQKQLDELLEYFQTEYENLQILGGYVLEPEQLEDDGIINEINSLSPDILLASLPSPFQEEFVFANKSKLNARLYLGLGKHKKIKQSLGLKPGWLSKLVDKALFKRMVTKYNDEKGE
jgi:UDP-N-acetyl-D-mannosaminuronic acid transferase (WecB/TagA/CpsF family)